MLYGYQHTGTNMNKMFQLLEIFTLITCVYKKKITNKYEQEMSRNSVNISSLHIQHVHIHVSVHRLSINIDTLFIQICNLQVRILQDTWAPKLDFPVNHLITIFSLSVRDIVLTTSLTWMPASVCRWLSDSVVWTIISYWSQRKQ